MASGSFSRASAKPRSGSPESMISYVSLSSRRIRRRNASSSSTTNTFPMALFLLAAGQDIAPRKFGRLVHNRRRFFPAIQHLADLPDKNLFRERFVQEVHSRIQNSVSRNEAVRITRNVEHLHSWLARRQLFRQSAAVHAGHHDVSQQEIKSAAKARRDFQSFFTAPRRQHAESACFKNSLLKLSQRLGVFHQKDAFRTAKFFSRIDFLFRHHRLTRMSREIDLKGGAFSWRAIHPNISITLFYDAVDGRKSKSRALAAFLGREEWLKDMCERSGVHSCSCVGHGQKHVIPGLGTWMVPRVGQVKLHVSGLDLQFAARGHGVARVDSQVHDDLFDLAL